MTECLYRLYEDQKKHFRNGDPHPAGREAGCILPAKNASHLPVCCVSLHCGIILCLNKRMEEIP